MWSRLRETFDRRETGAEGRKNRGEEPGSSHLPTVDGQDKKASRGLDIIFGLSENKLESHPGEE